MSIQKGPISLSQQAYERIKQKIIALELAPGAIIDESALRAELGLGRTPIREALQRLALEKLVLIAPRRGMFVSDIGITDLNRLFEVRLELESFAARLAAQRGNEHHWRRMETVLNSLTAAGGQGDNQDLISVDEACHAIMYEAADNEFLRDTLQTHYALSLRLWYFSLSHVGDMQSAVLEHRFILEALRDRQVERAGELLRQHIQAFQEEIQAVMLGKPDVNGEHIGSLGH